MGEWYLWLILQKGFRARKKSEKSGTGDGLAKILGQTPPRGTRPPTSLPGKVVPQSDELSP